MVGSPSGWGDASGVVGVALSYWGGLGRPTAFGKTSRVCEWGGGLIGIILKMVE